ncbi:serine hydrolase domain-containing protein [Marinobacter sp. F4206]|uniref:serine hydrolase domain-containing protein n=1 Tax=Marinobacter sp. F4206 TaxID=2861777 RepID=UPI001C5CECBF|nr:serine hydrolase [Marinobacter sp. F4206]MBW4936016.1 beta-lactamase family protein [Marinobacter sp. F4206]
MQQTTATQERTLLEEFQNGFPSKLENQTRAAGYMGLFAGGDVSAYFNMRASEFMNTAVLPSRQPVMPLGSRPMPEIGSIKAETINDGEMTLDQFLARSDLYAQGYLVVHKGEIVYEQYPRMNPEDAHLWMSCAKPTAGLIVDMLISEGKIDENQPITTYLTEFKNTDWDGITTRDVLDMATGMDLEDTTESRFDPDNVARRVYEAELGFSNVNRGVELLADVLKSTKAKSKPGQAFEYASGLTQVLVLLAEAVEGERWPQMFDRRVWSKVGAESALQFHLTPDGIAAAHGLVSSNLRDFARFGMLYTPSWNKIAVEKVVSDEILARIRSEVRTHDFIMAGFDGPVFADYHGTDNFIANSRQWDLVWPDGDLWKGGLMTQGLYVSPARDLVIVYFSVNNDDHSTHRFARPIATSGLFDH